MPSPWASIPSKLIQIHSEHVIIDVGDKCKIGYLEGFLLGDWKWK